MAEPEYEPETDSDSETDTTTDSVKNENEEYDDSDEGEDEEDDDVEEEEEEEGEAAAKAAALYNTMDDSDSSDDEKEEDQFRFQKLDKISRSEIIENYHTELLSHNYDEIEVLSRVVRDVNGNIVDPLHRSLPFITKYEKTRILGERAKQIDAGAEVLVPVEEELIDGYLIAKKEYDAGKIPFIIKRPLPNGSVEYWKFRDLEFLV